MSGVTAIRIVKGSTTFHVHGDQAGTEGIWLAKGQVQGIYDAPVKTTWKTGAFQQGSTQKAVKWLHRDLELGFHIVDTATSMEANESPFMRIWEYEEDFWDQSWAPPRIEVETDLSGTRKLDVLKYEQPELDTPVDPQQEQHVNVILKLRAADPFWYEDNAIVTFSNTGGSASGTVTVSNPTDQSMFHKWILTVATWTLPDQSWVGAPGSRILGGAHRDRTIIVPVTSGNGGAVVDLDRQNLMFRDPNNTNLLAQLSGKFFNYEVPPYTPPTLFGLSYTNAPSGGAAAQLVQPRRWSRPWGLEMDT